MSAKPETPIMASDIALIKQWMSIVNEFIEKNSKYMEYKYQLPDEWDHKLRLMQHLAENLSGDSAELSLERLYKCNSCKYEFDTPGHASFGGSHFEGQGEVCPNCNSTFKLV